MSTEWITAIDKRPGIRNEGDVDAIATRLRRVDCFGGLPYHILQQLATIGAYEDLEKGVTLFKEGDDGYCWYALLSGTLAVRLLKHHDSENKGPITVQYLSAGVSFGESLLEALPRSITVVTQTTCELFKVSNQDLKTIWESPSAQMTHVGWVLRTLLLSRSGLLYDRKAQGRLVRRCASGTELVDWLIDRIDGCSRQQASAMWQALLEEGVIMHANREHEFKDKPLLYQFVQDVEGNSPLPTPIDVSEAEQCLTDSLTMLSKRAPDATLRLILRKPSQDRTPEELEMIYDELVHITALSHLSNSVKKELASVIMFEAHTRAGTVLFEQGQEGQSWYIILRGSVDVVIHGKGVVTVLQEGDDFGKLALINDSPRAASIVLKENNCHFLRVDKESFNRILRDVEANTVRLEEHGAAVLVLEKIRGAQQSQFKYTVVAGTSQKMLEHLLETRLDGRPGIGGKEILHPTSDHFVDDFLLSYPVFMATEEMIAQLARQYHVASPSQDREYLIASKKRVVRFVHRWVVTVKSSVFEDPDTIKFLDDLTTDVENEMVHFRGLVEEASLVHYLTTRLAKFKEEATAKKETKWKLPPGGQPVTLFSGVSGLHRQPMRPEDEIIFRVYCADHTYCTLCLPLESTAEEIKIAAAERLKLRNCDDLGLAEVKSTGERILIKDQDVNVPTGLSLNGRLFVSPRDHMDALTIIPEQEQATEASEHDIELFSTKELAYHMTLFDWDLLSCVHEHELMFHAFGKHRFGEITANLEVFLRRFNEIQYWVATEILSTAGLGKRVTLLKKMIKLASYCKEYQNFNAFVAIVLGLSNVAVSRLSLTWEKLPGKFRKMFTEFELLTDPLRNHRAYRVAVGKLQPPVLPFVPLLIKDMNFIHDNHKTYIDGLVNFEKMHMLAATLRTLRYARSRHLALEPPSPKSDASLRAYVSCFRTIDNQKQLTSMSHKLEPRRS